VEFDEATALLVGDALQALAFELIATPQVTLPPIRQLEMVRLLGEASGSRGMAGGQAFDLHSVGRQLDVPELEFMHIHKTGALIRAAVLLGAHVGGANAEQLALLSRHAHRVGLLFQVVDDILDASTDTATLGKTAGKDAASNKPTYVTLLGIGAAKELAEQLRTEAHLALVPFGASANRLTELTDFIVDRTF
jgi:farnesyl diphosphate synthase